MVKKINKEKTKKDKKVMEDEFFKIEKDGKEKKVNVDIFEEKEVAPSKKEIKKENKIFMGVVIAMASFVLMLFIGYIIINSINRFDYNGVKFEGVKIGDLMFYDTSLPVTVDGKLGQYHFYLRTDPRKMEDVPFWKNIRFKENMVLNMTNDFNCDGDGMIAIANFLKLQEIIGTKVIKDENATCDDVYGKYTFVRIQPGNETKITEFGLRGGCYNIEIKDCEILKGTEKFMLETFVELKKRLN